MSKAEFLQAMRTTRAELNEAISGLSEDQMSQELVTGEWTIKDVLAHLAAWESEALLSVERAERGEEPGPMIAESIDEWNARRVEERRRIPLVDVIQEFNDSHDQLLTALERWPENKIPLGPDGWDATSELWWLTEHDHEHVGAIQRYRKRLAQP